MLDANQLEQDAATPVPTNESLAQVSSLVARQVSLEDEIEELENLLKARRAELQRLSTDEVPAALSELGISDLKLVTGEKVEIVPFVQASIPVARREEAFVWLRDHGYGDIVKHEIKLLFGKADDDIARVATDLLRESGFSPEDKEFVHPQTLKAFVREQTEQGAEGFPLDLFGAYLGQKSKITRK